MIESIVLGIIQGIAEWLPISPEKMIVFTKIYLFQDKDLSNIVVQVLPLRWGVFFAVLFYFRGEILGLIKTTFSFKQSAATAKKTLLFVVSTAIISGVVGSLLLFALTSMSDYFQTSEKVLTLCIAILLIITVLSQKGQAQPNARTIQDLDPSDVIVLGIIQGLTILPGLPRFGLTVPCFLMRQFDKISSLRLSFLMGLPVMFAGNLGLGFAKGISLSWSAFAGFIFAFFSGLLAIHGLIKFAEKIETQKLILLLAFLFLLSSSLLSLFLFYMPR